jgi:hypothetical protein
MDILYMDGKIQDNKTKQKHYMQKIAMHECQSIIFAYVYKNK